MRSGCLTSSARDNGHGGRWWTLRGRRRRRATPAEPTEPPAEQEETCRLSRRRSRGSGPARDSGRSLREPLEQLALLLDHRANPVLETGDIDGGARRLREGPARLFRSGSCPRRGRAPPCRPRDGKRARRTAPRRHSRCPRRARAGGSALGSARGARAAARLAFVSATLAPHLQRANLDRRGRESSRAGRAAGRGMELDEAIDYALSPTEHAGASLRS